MDYNLIWKDYEESVWKLDRYRYLKSYKLLEKEKVGRLLGIGTFAWKGAFTSS